MADNKRDYYEVLGVPKNADEAAIKRAYRTLAKKYHPDANPGDQEAEAKFKEASEAYAVLIDPDKRAKYDQFGHAAFDGAGAGGFDMNSAEFSDIFSDIFGDLFGGGGFGGFGGFSGFGGFGSRGRSYGGPMQGANTRARIRISFKEAIIGVTKKLEINLKEACPDCGGSGAKKGTSPVTCSQCGGSGQVTMTQQTIFGMSQTVRVCPSCSGSGKIIKEKCPGCGGGGYIARRQQVEVSIPAGIDDGQSVRIRGKGEPGQNGGPFGDLLVEVRVAEDPHFAREDTDIFSAVHLSFAQAALGDTIRIPTVDGEVEYELKGGTQPGTRIRLRGKGVPYLRQPGIRGDHYVTFFVDVPQKMNKEQKEALLAFDAAMGGKLSGGEEGGKKKKGFFK